MTRERSPSKKTDIQELPLLKGICLGAVRSDLLYPFPGPDEDERELIGSVVDRSMRQALQKVHFWGDQSLYRSTAASGPPRALN